MRIFYVISELGFGGAEKQLVELSKQLCRRGHAVSIYTLNDQVARKAELEGSGVELVIDQKRSKLDFAVLRRLRRAILERQPDVVHGFLFDGDIYARLAAFATGVPVLNSERNDSYELSLLQKVAHRATRRLARGVVANTYAGKAFAERMYPLRSDAVHVVWNGMRLEQLEREAAREDESIDVRRQFFGDPAVRVACLVGAIKPQKDYHLALETAARLLHMDPRWRVLFIGDQLESPGFYKAGRGSDTASYKEQVMRRYHELGLGEKVKFAGLRKDVPALVSRCDVLFVTSRHEGFPNVVLEAMALEVPVVSTRYSDIERILPFPDQIVRRRSPEALAHEILRAHRLRDAIASCQKQWVRTHATIERAAQELEHVYCRYVRSPAIAQPA